MVGIGMKKVGGGQLEIWGIDARVTYRINTFRGMREKSVCVSENLNTSNLFNSMDVVAFSISGPDLQFGMKSTSSNVDQLFGDVQMRGGGGDADLEFITVWMVTDVMEQ